MSYVGEGGQGQVLTFDAGTTKWMDSNPGGSGVIGVTVAEFVPADFTTISAAIAASNRIINVIGDTTEGSTISVPNSGLSITMFNAADVDLGTNNFVWTDNSNVDIGGNGSITFGYSSATELFDHAGFNLSRVTVDGITLNNNSTDTATLSDGVDGRFSNLVINGDAVLDGTRNQINDTDINGNLIVSATASNAKVSDCQVNGTITDNGTNTVISDTDNY